MRFDGVDNASNCSSFNTLRGYLEWINLIDPDLVVLVGRWSMYIDGWYRSGVLQSAHHGLKTNNDSEEFVLSDRELRKQSLLKAFEQTVDDLKSKHVAVMDQPMDYGFIDFSYLVRNKAIPKGFSDSWN